MKAVYAGSFDAYTNGHKSIIKKTYKLFDEIHGRLTHGCSRF